MSDKQTTLSFTDRVIISAYVFFPVDAGGSYEELVAREDFMKKVKITQEEIIEYKLTTNEKDKNITWALGSHPDEFSYTFTDLEKNEVKKVLENLSTAKKLTTAHMNLYKQFVQ